MNALVRTQIELAETEVQREAAKAERVAGMWGGAALHDLPGAVLVSFATAWGLAEVMPESVAFLVVGVLYAIAAAVL
jgi:hypothetical protein